MDAAKTGQKLESWDEALAREIAELVEAFRRIEDAGERHLVVAAAKHIADRKGPLELKFRFDQ